MGIVDDVPGQRHRCCAAWHPADGRVITVALSWWVVIPSLAEQNAAATPKDAKLVSFDQGSANDNTLLNTDNGGVKIDGKMYYRYMGPFTSKSEAQAAMKSGPPSTAPVPGLPGVGVNPGGGISVNPLAGLEGLTAIIGAFLSSLSDGKMWRSFGWLVLGVLMIIGTAVLLAKKQGGKMAELATLAA